MSHYLPSFLTTSGLPPSWPPVSGVLTHEPSLSDHVIVVLLGFLHSHASQLIGRWQRGGSLLVLLARTGLKGTVVDWLVTKYNFAHYSVRGYLLGEMKKRKIKNTDRDAMRRLANEIRANQSPSYIVEQLFDEAQRPVDSCPEVPISIIESIRVPMEALALRRRAEGNFFLLAVDANPTTRYNRIIKRQSETDSVTFSEFMQQEKFEMQNAEKHKQNLKGCLEMADKLILNDTPWKN